MADKELNLKELISIFVKNKFFIVIFSTIFALFSVFFALSIPNSYTSSAVVKVNSDKDQSNISSSLSQYANIASIAGISLPSSGSDKSEFVIKSIQSRDFFKYIFKFDKIGINLFAASNYDKDLNEIKYNPKLYDSDKKKWTRKAKDGSISIPTYLEVYEEVYSEKLSIVKDKDSGFIFISFSHVSPFFSEYFLSLIIDEINTITRKKDLEDSRNSLEYLKNQLTLTKETSIKKSINVLIMEQLGTQMIANINDDYIVEYIDKPFVPEKKSAPLRAFICIMISTLGGILSLLIVFIKERFFG